MAQFTKSAETIKKHLNAMTAVVFVVAFLLGYGISSEVINRNKAIDPEFQEVTQREGQREGEEQAEKIAFAPELASLSGAAVSGTDIAVETPAALPQAQGSASMTAAVHADDQPAGATAVVTMTAEKDLWVAIHEDANGAPGRILGAQMFSTGARTGAVGLLRATEEERKYYAVIHTDDGDRAFDQKKDTPLKNADGTAVMHAFMTLATAPEAVQ